MFVVLPMPGTRTGSRCEARYMSYGAMLGDKLRTVNLVTKKRQSDLELANMMKQTHLYPYVFLC